MLMMTTYSSDHIALKSTQAIVKLIDYNYLPKLYFLYPTCHPFKKRPKVKQQEECKWFFVGNYLKITAPYESVAR